jgi:hypothetical protein
VPEIMENKMFEKINIIEFSNSEDKNCGSKIGKRRI